MRTAQSPIGWVDEYLEAGVRCPQTQAFLARVSSATIRTIHLLGSLRRWHGQCGKPLGRPRRAACLLVSSYLFCRQPARHKGPCRPDADGPADDFARHAAACPSCSANGPELCRVGREFLARAVPSHREALVRTAPIVVKFPPGQEIESWRDYQDDEDIPF